MKPVPRVDIDRLVEGYLSGSLSPQEFRQLESLLTESPELCSKLLNSAGMQLDLELLTNERPPATQSCKSSINRRTFRRPAVWMALAVLFGLSLAYFAGLKGRSLPIRQAYLTESQSNDQRSLPTVVESAQAKLFGYGLEPKSGMLLELNKEYVLTHGQLAVRFAKGARIVLTAPAVFSPTELDALEVRSGGCSVYAPPGAEGFKVYTPSADIVDLGTRFVLDVAVTGETELLVVDGAATLAAKSQDTVNPILLRDGESARVEPEQLPETPSATASLLRFQETLPDRVVRYQTTTTSDGFADELLSVVVQRDGNNLEYQRNDLIRTRVVHFTGQQNAATFTTRLGEPLTEGEARLSLLDGDWSLVTGLINPKVPQSGGSKDELESVMTVEFLTPIVNGPGPDVLLFDLQLLVYREEGDRIKLMSGDELEDAPILAVDQFDITLTSPYALDLAPHHTHRALQATTSREDLVRFSFEHGRQTNVDAKGLVVGIDLEDLGYAPGEELRRLTFLENNEDNSVDPVLIVGLPNTPAR